MGTDYLNVIEKKLKDKYVVYNLQEIWDSSGSEEQKEALFRKQMQKSDILFNVYTGNYFWAKASYAKLIKKKVITYWIGEDVKKILSGENGYLGQQLLDKHLVASETLQLQLEGKGIIAELLPIMFEDNMGQKDIFDEKILFGILDRMEEP